jgi:hypothetical protein
VFTILEEILKRGVLQKVRVGQVDLPQIRARVDKLNEAQIGKRPQRQVEVVQAYVGEVRAALAHNVEKLAEFFFGGEAQLGQVQVLDVEAVQALHQLLE